MDKNKTPSTSLCQSYTKRDSDTESFNEAESPNMKWKNPKCKHQKAHNKTRSNPRTKLSVNHKVQTRIAQGHRQQAQVKHGGKETNTGEPKNTEGKNAGVTELWNTGRQEKRVRKPEADRTWKVKHDT